MILPAQPGFYPTADIRQKVISADKLFTNSNYFPSPATWLYDSRTPLAGITGGNDFVRKNHGRSTEVSKNTSATFKLIDPEFAVTWFVLGRGSGQGEEKHVEASTASPRQEVS
jgi:hypothetical protein